jgi:hypothetical protein
VPYTGRLIIGVLAMVVYERRRGSHDPSWRAEHIIGDMVGRVGHTLYLSIVRRCRGFERQDEGAAQVEKDRWA